MKMIYLLCADGIYCNFLPTSQFQWYSFWLVDELSNKLSHGYVGVSSIIGREEISHKLSRGLIVISFLIGYAESR